MCLLGFFYIHWLYKIHSDLHIKNEWYYINEINKSYLKEYLFFAVFIDFYDFLLDYWNVLAHILSLSILGIPRQVVEIDFTNIIKTIHKHTNKG